MQQREQRWENKMGYEYAYKDFDKQRMARFRASNLKISLKKSVELARLIRGKKVNLAIEILDNVIDCKKVVPYKKYKAEMPHKRGRVAVGRYPVLAAKEFKKVLISAQKCAKEKELGNNLIIISCSVRKGQSRYKQSRFTGRQMKSTHLEIVLCVLDENSKKIKETKMEVKNDWKKNCSRKIDFTFCF